MKQAKPILFILYCTLFSSCFFLSTSSHKDHGIKSIVIVRHAEKSDNDPQDPDLSAEGFQRADRLALHFKDWSFDALYTTKYERCIQTTEPLASTQGLQMELYSVDTLFEFAEHLRKTEHSSVFVAGHSNTNPHLINYLIGTEIYNDIPSNEYDGIYVVTLSEGISQVKILRY